MGCWGYVLLWRGGNKVNSYSIQLKFSWVCKFGVEFDKNNIKPNIEPNIEPNIGPNIETNIELNIEPNMEPNIEPRWLIEQFVSIVDKWDPWEYFDPHTALAQLEW